MLQLNVEHQWFPTASRTVLRRGSWGQIFFLQMACMLPFRSGWEDIAFTLPFQLYGSCFTRTPRVTKHDVPSQIGSTTRQQVLNPMISRDLAVMIKRKHRSRWL